MAKNGSREHEQLTPFGREMARHFQFDKTWTNLNHGKPPLRPHPLRKSPQLTVVAPPGSFGTYPAPVREELHRFQALAEARPDPFVRYHYSALLDKSRAAVASLLNAPPDEIVFLPNATTGVNTVLRSLVFEEGDAIAYFSSIYGACEKTVQYICETTPARAIRIEADYPIGDKELLRRFKDALKQVKEEGKGRVRIALFDTVVSLPGVRMPFEDLVDLCRQEGVLSLVDGAHGVGHLELDLGRLDADFFVSNCHKWLFVPRGCAVFHVPTRNHPLIRSSIPTSHGFVPLPSTQLGPSNSPLPPSSQSPFVYLFEFVGTIDNSPYLCVPAALAFRERVCGGEARIREYCFGLARDGGRRVAELLGTDVLENEEGTLTRCCFANVRLPLAVSGSDNDPWPHEARRGPVLASVRPELVAQTTNWVARTMADEYDTFIAVAFHGSSWWARFSAQVYLDMGDFETGARVLRELCERVGKGDVLKDVEGAKEQGRDEDELVRGVDAVEIAP